MNQNHHYNLADVPAGQPMEPQQLLVDLQIYTEAIFRTLYQNNKPVQRDELHPLDLARALANLDSGTGLLPPDVLFYNQSGQLPKLGIFLPPRVQNLHVDGRRGPETYTIPLPACIFVGRGYEYQVFALDTIRWPQPQTPLYRAPLPNVYLEPTGRVCHGTVEFPAAAPTTIHQAANLFFASQFNSDLGNGKSRRFSTDVVAMWAAVASQNLIEYPVDDLVPTDLTLESLL